MQQANVILLNTIRATAPPRHRATAPPRHRGNVNPEAVVLLPQCTSQNQIVLREQSSLKAALVQTGN